MRPARTLVRILEYSHLAADTIEVTEAATARGISLHPTSPQYIAAARLYHVAIWVGNDANIPRWRRAGTEFRGAR